MHHAYDSGSVQSSVASVTHHPRCVFILNKNRGHWYKSSLWVQQSLGGHRMVLKLEDKARGRNNSILGRG